METSEKTSNALAKLFYFMQGDKPRMAVSLVLACLGEALGMLPYLAIALLAAGLIEGTLTLETAALLATGAACAHIAKFFLTWHSSMTSHRIAFKALRTMRESMAEKMARVPMGEIIDTPTGTIKNRFIDNVNVLEDSIAHFMPELPSNVFGPLLGFIIVFILDWRMGLASLATIPLGILFYAAMMRDYQTKMETYVTSEQHLNSSLVEYVNGIQVIKAFGRTASSYAAFSDAVNDYHDSTISWFKQSWVWMAAIRSVMPCTLLVALPLGVLFMSQNTLSLPVFLTCIVIPLSCIGPVMKFAQAASQIAVMDACLNVIWDFLGTPELKRPTKRVELTDEGFALNHVSFSYRSGIEVLHDINLTTKPGQITAIVGPSGSGKSTIAKLMAGFWDATDGCVNFGGQDVRDIPSSQLAEHISYVSQDTFLFDMSIADNIRLGCPDATDDEVRKAAILAHCDEFICALPQGYATLAGEAGGRLSGGERQRIAIARAILKDASIIILDEATAYADPENESFVEQALTELVAHKTLIVIAHRLSTIQHADCIVVMDEGRIVGRGLHRELLTNCPTYARMWESHIQTLGLEEGACK
ncbi:MAG: ABC transporter ATP-binding protein [Atopobium sp.]|uniref:ABC transporter ATP-binding protein n=1 Tax=Atopobium sp. TaxID=1872650 RepID=UPI002A749C3D|nr:ABC transporter ATP-binding protein [Atopobium sp.]MDY2788008.1 ABC transporter ATP-binding protein [Atopobium sp.]